MSVIENGIVKATDFRKHSMGMYRTGCGCVIIPLTCHPHEVLNKQEAEQFQYILVEYCGSWDTEHGDDGLRFTYQSTGHIHDYNLQNAQLLEESQLERLCDRIGHRISQGSRFEQVQHLLGIEVKP